MLDFCLLHYLMSSDSETMTLYKCHYSIHYFLENFNKKTKLVLYWIILKDNTSRLGSAIQLSLADIGEYLSCSFFSFDFYFYFTNWKMFFVALQILLSERQFTYLLTYLLIYFFSFFLLLYSLVTNSNWLTLVTEELFWHFRDNSWWPWRSLYFPVTHFNW